MVGPQYTPQHRASLVTEAARIVSVTEVSCLKVPSAILLCKMSMIWLSWTSPCRRIISPMCTWPLQQTFTNCSQNHCRSGHYSKRHGDLRIWSVTLNSVCNATGDILKDQKWDEKQHWSWGYSCSRTPSCLWSQNVMNKGFWSRNDLGVSSSADLTSWRK